MKNEITILLALLVAMAVLFTVAIFSRVPEQNKLDGYFNLNMPNGETYSCAVAGKDITCDYWGE